MKNFKSFISFNESLSEKVIHFENPIIVYSDPAETIEALSIKGTEVSLQYSEYDNVYKTETKDIKHLPENVQDMINNYGKKNNNHSSRQHVEVEIPNSIIEICQRHNISDSNIKEVFLNYINYTLGIEYGTETQGFEIYCEESDNITDYIN